MKFTNDGRRYVIVLKRGEEVIASISEFCDQQGVGTAAFQGIGSIDRIQIGSYDIGRKQYDLARENTVFELISMQGNVTQLDGKPFVHAHAALSRTDGTNAAIGGHLKEAHVAATVEIFLIALDVTISRKIDDETGLKLMDI